MPLDICTEPAFQRQLAVHVRWMIRNDWPAVLQIEEICFVDPWDEEYLEHLKSKTNCILMVAEHREKVVGYFAYILHKNHLELINLATHPGYRRQGVGQQMMAKLKSKLGPHRRACIECTINERAEAMTLFLRAMGFRADRLLRGYCDDGESDAYLMVCGVEDEG